MAKTASQKMGIKPDSRAILINATATVIKAMDLPDVSMASTLRGGFDYIHYFAKDKAHLEKTFPSLKNHLNSGGMLWISWKKGLKGESKLTLGKIISIGYDNGLVESKTLSIDVTWSAIKFTHPIKGKIYNNSYGTLKH